MDPGYMDLKSCQMENVEELEESIYMTQPIGFDGKC